MKHKLLLAGLMILFSLSLFADLYSGSCGDNLTWTFKSETGVLTISGTGAIFYYENRTPWRDLGESIKQVVINEGVTALGHYDFIGCSNLTSVSIPETVTSLSSWSFAGTALYNNESNWENGVLYLGNWLICAKSSLSDSYQIKDQTRGVAAGAFNGCTDLNSVVIPESVKNIGENAFYRTALYNNESNWENEVLYVDNWLICAKNSLSGSYQIKDQTRGIADYAFNGYNGLTMVIIPKSVTNIGENAFYGVYGINYNGTATGSPWGATNVNLTTDGWFTFSGMSKSILVSCSTEATGEIIIPDGVTEIRDYAFVNCGKVTSVTIPESVTSIGKGAFEGTIWYNDENYLENGVLYIDNWLISANSSLSGDYQIKASTRGIADNAFYGCSGLKSVIIGNSVTNIGQYAFFNCSGLGTVTIPESVTGIGNLAFYGVYDINYNGTATGSPWGAQYVNLVTDGWLTFCGMSQSVLVSCSTEATSEIIIPDGVTSIEKNAFQNCSGITSVVIPQSVTSIGSNAFYGCSGLTSVHINDLTVWCGIQFSSAYSNPLYIAHHLYLNDEEITDLMIPDGMTSINDYAFDGCSSLASVTIPGSVTSIGSNAFAGCEGLTSVKLNSNAIVRKAYTSYSFSGLKSIFGSQVSEYILGEDVTSIGDYAFYGCNELTSVTIGNNVTNIGNSAFSNCSSLISVTLNSNAIVSRAYTDKSGLKNIFGSQVKTYIIGENVMSIGDYAFYSCYSLTSVNIPASVTRIGNYAFASDYNLTPINIPNSVKSIGKAAFSGVNDISYNGSATGFPWGAKYVNRVTEGWLTFCGMSKSVLVSCSTEATGEIVIPDRVISIENGAFQKCSGITSVIIPESVTSIGSSVFSNCSSLTSVTIGSSVKSIGSGAFNGTALYNNKNNWENGVLYVGNWLISANNSLSGDYIIKDYTSGIVCYAFSDCSSLTSITIPNSVTSIGDYAFRNCSGLTSVNISKNVTRIGNYTFYGCNKLTSVSIPTSVTTISEYAFSGCSSLEAVTIPYSVDSIGDYAFSGCKGLTSITIPNSVTSIGKKAFSGCSGLTSVTIPKSVTSIGEDAFTSCSTIVLNSNYIAGQPYSSNAGLKSMFGSQVKEYVFGDAVTRIGDFAFYDFGGLSSVTISNSVTSIGRSAFYRCSGLTSVIIPESVTSIGEYAFSNCSGLTSVTIPGGVTSIGYDAFYEVLNIVYNGSATGSPWGAKNVNGYVDGYFLFSDEAKTHLVACSTAANGEIVIPDGVTSIGNKAFYRCSGLTSVVIPNGVTSIGSNAFFNCSGLTSVIIPESVTSIREYAFYNCSSLTSVVIPNGVTSIGSNAFFNCSGLTSVTIPGSVTSIGYDAFYGTALYKDAGNWEDGVLYVDNWLICAKTELPSSYQVKEQTVGIASNAFSYSGSSTTITVPESVTSIGESAFNGVLNVIYTGTATGSPWGAKYVNGYVDEYFVYSDEAKTNLVACSKSATGEIVIPEGVTSIGDYAFEYCRSLTSVTIPNSVTSIGEWAFSDCNGLTAVHISDIAAWCGIQFGSAADYYSYYNYYSNPLYYAHHLYLNDVEITDLVIPDGVTGISSYAFYDCSGLTSVTIPNSVTIIGYGAFRNCSGLTSVHISNLTAWCGIRFDSNDSNPLYNAHHLYLNDEEITNLVIPNGVTSISNYAFYGCSSLTSVTIPNSVTSIGINAFANCSGLTSMTIPNSVTSIGNWAFGNIPNILYNGSAEGSPWGAIAVNGYSDGYCIYDASKTTLLKCSTSATGDVVIPDGVTNIADNAFVGCSGLTSVAIPNSVTSIGSNAFSGCSGLTSVTIPDGVTSIGDYTFSGCSGLTSVTIPSSITSIGSDAFSGCEHLTTVHISDIAAWCGIQFGSSETYYYSNYRYYSNPLYYAHHLYLNDEEITDLVIPDGVTSIGDYAFYNCNSLTSVTIPNSVTSIGTDAFYGCNNLPVENNLRYAGTYLIGAVNTQEYSYSIKEGTKWIGKNAFGSCKYMTSITIPNSVKIIESNAFYSCYNLKEVHISDLAAWCKIPFYYGYGGSNYSISFNTPLYYAHQLYLNDTEITDLVIPDGVTGISDYAFYGCNSLTSVTIPNSVTSIGSNAFYDCTGLTTLTIPNSVTSIGSSAFYGCSNLSTITLNAETPPELQSNSIESSKLKHIYVPCGTKDEYNNSSSWEKYSYCIGYANNPYNLELLANQNEGSVSHTELICDITIEATPNKDYKFLRWSDGNTDNPRLIDLTQDTTLTALFGYAITGLCGDDNALQWAFDSVSNTLAITGNGALCSNYTFGLQAPSRTERLIALKSPHLPCQPH